MSGGITQLVAIGAQDAHLVGDPQVSFFRSTYKRHTNFSHVVERQVIQGNPSPGGISTVRLERKGDMVNYIYLTKKSSSKVVKFKDESTNPIEKVELLIGGQVIDTQTNEFITEIADQYLVSSVTKSVDSNEIYLMYPLHFWFNENWQSSLPLVSLQYHDVELRITWATPGNYRYECWCNFIYLDTIEREQFASSPQQHLIYQVQRAIAPEVGSHSFEINFNHPIKFLAASDDLVGDPETTTLQLQVNGVQVGEPKTYSPHFNMAPKYYHANYMTVIAESGFLIPFCLDTNKLQPTGTLNFSRLDSVRLVSSNNGFKGGSDIYGVNYNVLRIENGMGGLMYSN